LAAGRFDGFWELRLQPWDVAAAALTILEAAGGSPTFREGRSTSIRERFLASNGLIHDEMLLVIHEIHRKRNVRRKA